MLGKPHYDRNSKAQTRRIIKFRTFLNKLKIAEKKINSGNGNFYLEEL